MRMWKANCNVFKYTDHNLHTLQLLSGFLFGEETFHEAIPLVFNNTESCFNLRNGNGIRNKKSVQLSSERICPEQTYPGDVHHLFDSHSRDVHLLL